MRGNRLVLDADSLEGLSSKKRKRTIPLAGSGGIVSSRDSSALSGIPFIVFPSSRMSVCIVRISVEFTQWAKLYFGRISELININNLSNKIRCSHGPGQLTIGSSSQQPISRNQYINVRPRSGRSSVTMVRLTTSLTYRPIHLP